MSAMADWLNELGLGKYSEIFAENGIDLRSLPHLTEQDLVDLGVLLGHRRILLAQIEELETQAVTLKSDTGREPQEPTEAGEKRQVTILFADLVGYTELSSQLDAEEVHAVLGHFLDAADRIVIEHGGTVDKHLGDCVMAIFGAPVAHSNDPMRAAHAALEILDAMQEISTLAGRRLQVHIGIASGQVMASGVGSDAHYTVTGGSVNLASRLTDTAEAGEILLSQGVQMAIADEFELLDRGEVRLKGIAGPVTIYALAGLAAQKPGQEERPFVGRQAELQLVSGILQACREIHSGQVVYVRGEAGIGKTRLCGKFLKLANQKDYRCHRALVLDFGVGKEQSVIPTLVRSLLGIAADSRVELRLRKAEDAIEKGLLDPALRVHLNALLEVPQPIEMRSIYDAMERIQRDQGSTAVVTGLLDSLCAQDAQLVLIEDLHWADDSLIQFLAALTRFMQNRACVLVMTSRVEGDPLNDHWKQNSAATPLTTIDLSPLRQEDAMLLAADIFNASAEFAQKCVERAEGNPLYLEQLLRSAQEMGEDQVPGSVQSIVQARLDSLAQADRQAIQTASVLGQRFSLEALRFMIDASGYDAGQLLDRHLIKLEGEAFLFAHALVQEAVYQSLIRSRRAELHSRAAQWYVQREPELHAVHLDRAGDAGASRAYLLAAQSHMRELRFDPAFALASRGIELDSAEAVLCELTMLQGEVLRNMGQIDASIVHCRSAIESASEPVLLCRAWLNLVESLRTAEHLEEAFAALDTAESIAVESGLTREQSRIHYLRGNLYFMQSNIEGCLNEHEASLALSREMDSAEDTALALGGLGDAYYLSGRMQSARQQFQDCVRLCKEHGFGRIEVANRHMVGWCRIFLMEFTDSLADACAAFEMAQKVGHPRAEMLGRELAGSVELERGHFEPARRYIDQSLVLARQLNSGNFMAQALYLRARLGIAEGQKAAARESIDEARAIIREVGTTFIGPAVLAVCAVLEPDARQMNGYLEEAESLLEAGCVSHNYFQFGRIAIDIGLQHEDWDRVERSARNLEAYTENQPLAWSDYLIARGRALAAWGQGDHSRLRRQELEQLLAQAEAAELKLLQTSLQQALSLG